MKTSGRNADKGINQSITNESMKFLLQEKCCHYWPNDRSQRYHCFVVDPIAEYNLAQYTLREFKVSDRHVNTSR